MRTLKDVATGETVVVKSLMVKALIRDASWTWVLLRAVRSM